MAGRSARRSAATAIVARIPQAEVAAELAAALESHVTAFEHVSEDAHADIVYGLERNLSRWSRFLASGAMPPDKDFDPLREWTRTRATEGVRLEDLLRSFGVLHQLSWQLMRRHARAGESEALLELAGLLAEYIGQVSAVVTQTYLAERELLVSEEERSTQTLIEALCEGTPLLAGEEELAERLGVPVRDVYTPFAAALPGASPHRHAALAARLRRRGFGMTVTQSEYVSGLSWRPLELTDLGETRDGEALLVLGEPTARASLGAALDELATFVEHARLSHLRGVLLAEEHLLEIVLARSPRQLERLRRRLRTRLEQGEGMELELTLRTLLDCRLDRNAASAALHVHRNTLAYRLRRIEELCALDLRSPRDLALAYAALVQVHN
ncbi:MAG TPA: helix-turn-helix domain-containing protein [Solirubrobacteraceae bacterium]|jgi:hypothetical protein